MKLQFANWQLETHTSGPGSLRTWRVRTMTSDLGMSWTSVCTARTSCASSLIFCPTCALPAVSLFAPAASRPIERAARLSTTIGRGLPRLCPGRQPPGREDPNVVIEEHQRQGRCDPRNYKRVHERKRCCGTGCREKLTTVNSYVCKTCGQETCVRHRFRESHDCRVAQARRANGSGFFQSIKSFFTSF